MKKVIALILSLTLLLTGLLGSALAQDGTTIGKQLSQSEAWLGDTVTVTLTVNPAQAPVTVTDILPDQFDYVADTFTVDGAAVTPEVDGHSVSCELDTTGEHNIQFDMQMTTAEAETLTVSNIAQVGNATEILASQSVDIDVHPYSGFTKTVVDCTHDPWDSVPVGTDVHWFLLIEVENIGGDAIGTMEDVVVRDRFGGDLELDDYQTGNGTVTITETGCTKKVHLTWSEIADLEQGDAVQLSLEVSTDVNPGSNKNKDGKGRRNGHQEYTEAGEHCLNSGAVLKFVDGETGLKLSAHTPPILVTAYEVE
jgi:uncharacterized repeat protein (TIGR01451 family)